MASSPNYCQVCGATNPAQAAYCFACNNSLHPPRAAIGNAAIGPLVPSYLLHQRYTIVSQIGTGGFGAVYKAKDTLFSNRLVAIKEMNQGGLNPQELAEATATFQREALLLANLTHPNLPRIHDHFAENSRFYVVMDFIEGDTLEDYLDKIARRLPLVDVLDIGLQLCMALDYLHTHQPPIIFRDVKPANIMRTPNGQVYLIDFGIARHFKPGKAKDTVPLGSRGYAAPEQYGKAQTTPQSDIYGLGATLHQLLTGDDPSLTPFHFEPVQVRNSPSSSQLDSLFRQMLDMDMSKRPESMIVVRQELQRLLAHQTSNQLSPTQKSSLALVRRRSFVLGFVGLAAACGGSSVITRFVYERLAASAAPPAAHPLIESAPISPTTTPSIPNSVSLAAPLYTYRGHKGAVTSVAWSPQGQWIASTAALDNTVQVWEAATGNSVFIYALDPDTTNNETQRPRSIKIPAVFVTGKQRVDGLAWSPDSTRLASALEDDTVQVNSMEIGISGFTYSSLSGSGNALAWSPDGSRIASVVGTSSVEVWSVASGRGLFTYLDHPQAVLTLAWSPDGRRIASAGADDTVRVWDAVSGSSLFTYRRHSQAVSAITWSADGKWIASGSADSTVQVWDAATGRTLFTYRGHAGGVNAVAWSRQEPSSSGWHGSRIASGGEDGTVQVWSVGRAANARGAHIAIQGKILIYRGHAASVLSVTWSPDGKHIASGSEDGTVQVWSAIYKEQR